MATETGEMPDESECGFSDESLVKTLSNFVAALLLVGAGLACGYFARGFGASQRAVADFPQRKPKVTAPRAIEEKQASGDFTTRLDALANTGDPSRRTRAIAAIADDFDVREIREALANLERHSVRDADEIRLRLLARWAEFEPDAALQYAQGLPPGFVAPGAIEAVIASWAATDAKGSEERVARMPEGFAKQIARGALLPTLAESDPRRAFASLREAAASPSDTAALFKIWTEKDPADAAAHAAQLPGWQGGFALRTVMQKWAETDRESALAWAQSWQPPKPPGVTIERRDPAPLATVLQTWMNEDAGAAMSWLEQLPADAAKTDVLAALSKSLSEDEPQHAVEVAATMPTGKAQDSALRDLIRQWGQKDFAGALAWARQQPDEEIRQILLPTLVNNLAPRDPSAALQIALSVGGNAGTQAVKNVLREWAQREPAAAAEWADAQPTSAENAAGVASGWALKDRRSAMEWVRTIPAGATKDAALASGVLAISQTPEPQAAIEWIADIGGEEKRNEANGYLAWFWLRTDPKKAREWIQTAPLSAKAKADLLKQGPK